MGSDLLEVFMESSADWPGGPVDNLMALCRSMIVPKNSGIQNIMPNIIKSMNRAKLLRPPYRTIAMSKAKEALYGMASISSENSAMNREINTSRQAQTFNTNVGQNKDGYDEMIYGKQYLKNNPRGKTDSLAF